MKRGLSGAVSPLGLASWMLGALLIALTAWAVLVGALVALPVLAVISHVLSTGTSDTWSHLASTVLPDYLWSTLWLCLGVGLGTASMGVGAAWLVTRYNFPLRVP